jgi:hypothetical protein
LCGVRFVSVLSMVEILTGATLPLVCLQKRGGEWWQGSPVSRIILKWPEASTARPLIFARSG